jgi:hypothetical protein
MASEAHHAETGAAASSAVLQTAFGARMITGAGSKHMMRLIARLIIFRPQVSQQTNLACSGQALAHNLYGSALSSLCADLFAQSGGAPRY